jgi:hypothetical protein
MCQDHYLKESGNSTGPTDGREIYENRHFLTWTSPQEIKSIDLVKPNGSFVKPRIFNDFGSFRADDVDVNAFIIRTR